MLGSEVPPCCTITFDGGQFVAAFPVVVAGCAEVEGVEPAVGWPPVAGALTQLGGTDRLLCRVFLTVLGRVWPGDVFSGAAAGGVGAVGGWDVVDGFCAGGAAP